MLLDKEYKGCRIWDKWQNKDAIKKADAKFRKEAREKLGKKARRLVPGGKSVVRKA